MSKLLTIAIPTYNRANLLDQQLKWISSAIKGIETQIEVLVSDNCSSDHTSEVLKKWSTVITGLRVYGQPENLGALKNITSCMKLATGRFVWVLSDDDRVLMKSLEGILTHIETRPDLALLFLNYSCRSATGALKSQHRFRLKHDEENVRGKVLFEKYIAKGGGTGALVFTSALIYRTEYAQEAIERWSSGVGNLAYQLYVTGFCAIKGRFLLLKDIYLEFIGGRSHFMKNQRLLIQIKIADAPEIYAKFAEMGYAVELCRELFIRHLFRYSIRIRIVKWLITNPWTTIKSLSRLLRSTWRLYSGFNGTRSKVETYSSF